jgi:dihydropteroate synthase
MGERQKKQHTQTMGIVNVTPDSFSDGGQYASVDRAVAQVKQLIAEGADVIDIGGESTRPGAIAIDTQEEMRRVIPVLEALHAEKLAIPISIDTSKAAIATQALRYGASILNDVTAGRGDVAMLRLAAQSEVPIILMHQRIPRADRAWGIAHVIAEIKEDVQLAIDAGVAPQRIWVDPGFGFHKQPTHNVLLMHHLHTIVALGYRVVIGTSRKRFIRHTVEAEMTEVLPATLATAVMATIHGVHMVRVHDVKAHVQAIRMTEAILCAESSE